MSLLPIVSGIYTPKILPDIHAPHVHKHGQAKQSQTPRQMQSQKPIYLATPVPSHPALQPHPPKQHHNRDKEPQPRLPPHTRFLRHPQHPAHGALYLIPRVLKLVVHLLREGRRVADFVADEVC
jgi:hypothetical protein